MLPESTSAMIELWVRSGTQTLAQVFYRTFQEADLPLPPEVSTISEVDPALLSELEHALDQAFDRRIREAPALGSPTDDDRLDEAFQTLNERGILTLRARGATLDDSIRVASDIAAARAEAGLSTEGFCFYHEQDVWSALEEHRLYLGFGAFHDDELHSPTRKVGQIVAEACAAQGLTVRWDGSAGQRISLPFRWQPRPRRVLDDDVQSFLEDWRDEVRAGDFGHDIQQSLDDRATCWFDGVDGFSLASMRRLHAESDTLLERERRLESSWARPTVNDRIDAAFSALNAQGILALQSAGRTLHDGWALVGTQLAAHHEGAVFFHQEDVFDALRGEALLLAFRATGEATQSDHATIARRCVATLVAHGVDVTWSEQVGERVGVEPFEWRKRRWTEPPPLDDRRGTFRKTPPMPGVGELPLRDAVQIVTAVRAEVGFHGSRSTTIRRQWRSHDPGSRGQAWHVGLPTTFVQTGCHYGLCPGPAGTNLVAEVTEIIERGIRSQTPQ